MSKEKNNTPNYWNDQVHLRLQSIDWNSVDKLDPEKIHDDKTRELFEEFIKKWNSLVKYLLSYGHMYDEQRRTEGPK